MCVDIYFNQWHSLLLLTLETATRSAYLAVYLVRTVFLEVITINQYHILILYIKRIDSWMGL